MARNQVYAACTPYGRPYPLEAITNQVILVSVDADFLSLLFKFRALFRFIAASTTVETSTSVIVCWADIILAKLGQAIVAVAGSSFDVASSDHTIPQSVRAQRQDDMLRAAVQLPGESEPI